MAGFKIDGEEFEFPSRFRLGDPVLIEEVTGLPFDAFAERLDDMNRRIDEGEKNVSDMLVMTGLVAAAVWQAKPRWKRDRVVAFVNQVDIETSFEASDPPEESDEVPPVEAADESRSPESSDESTITPPLETEVRI
jgi:hypothetical protein